MQVTVYGMQFVCHLFMATNFVLRNLQTTRSKPAIRQLRGPICHA
ncbi:hypothetical protein M5D96_001677 [Drosophila gunungcola]|uniref:Uncharacterized protein n=1 Tax=Drosophila gunungcola TaxID=103775 RepID=A0A9P9YYY5_9MUSC|nr:hypothetical protein M5D96_001677 [Drosophila gunungcola]